MHYLLKFILTALFIVILPAVSFAMDKDDHSHHDMKKSDVIVLGALEISSPILRATPPNAPVGGGYIKIKNTGDETDVLLGGTAPFSSMVEVHEMKMENDIMKMRALKDGLEIPAGGEVVLKPGGYHLMFMKLDEQLVKGETRKVILNFEKAGEIELEFNVQDLKQIRDGMKHNH